jgi:uncharacterized protein
MTPTDGRRSDSHVEPPPRYLPDVSLPPYSYVTGRYPHPMRDRAGHSFGVEPEACPSPEPERWRECRAYLHGIDLFNHGYYWEAHEAWEQAWHAAGRRGTTADFLKALIKLAAAGVKAREGLPDGVRSHARRGAELFRAVIAALPTSQTHFFGLELTRLVAAAEAIDGSTASEASWSGKPSDKALAFLLVPSFDRP